MNDRLQFPEDDLERLKSDCDDLSEILLEHLDAHCAWLRLQAQRSDATPLPAATDWSPAEFEAILQKGFWSACKAQIIKPTQLRHAAQDPDLLEQLAERIFGEGAPEVWFPDSPTTDLTAESQTQSLLQKLSRLNPNRVSAAKGPVLRHDVTDRSYPAVPVRYGHRTIWRLEATVSKRATLSLRFDNRLWGKLQVERTSTSTIRIVACTGVFLMRLDAGEVNLRAAAESAAGPKDEQEAGQITLNATQGGIVLDIITEAP